MSVLQRPHPTRPDTTEAEPDPVRRFCEGEIDRTRAMAALGDVDYATLLAAVAARGLTLPSLPDDELGRMAREMNRLLDANA